MEVIEAKRWVRCGHAFSAAEVAEICATVAWLPRLPRTELAATLCEHLRNAPKTTCEIQVPQG